MRAMAARRRSGGSEANWARNVRWSPREVARPGSLDALRDVLARARRDRLVVRPAGSRHSFTPLCATDGIALDLAAFSGLRSVDGDLVTVGAGTPLHGLNLLLHQRGRAMANLGDIDRQTLAGAASTGTHGTGARQQGIAAQIESLTLVTAAGDAVTCSRQHQPNVFLAACVGLGALGIVTEMTLRTVPAFGMDIAVARGDRRTVVADLELHTSADHFEFFWFPLDETAQLKSTRRMAPGERVQPLPPARAWLEDVLLENGAMAALCAVGRRRPAALPRLHRWAGAAISERRYSDESFRVFASKRWVRFVESEYAVPVPALPGVLDAVAELARGLPVGPAFPVEVRFAAADDVWLSTAFERDNAYVAVHQYAPMPYVDFMAGFAAICAEVGGRPHWGKMHPLGAVDLVGLYPRFGHVAALRRELDPDGVLLNAHLRHVFGED
jgi:FAD-linked oxidoreductase